MKHSPTCLWLVLCAALGGCGKSHKVVPVTGTVTQAGAGVPNLVVHFLPEDGQASKGFTDQQGKFTLQYNKTTKGAEIGKHKVYVEFRAASPLEEGKEGRERTLTDEQKTIINRFGNAQAPVIDVTIDKKDQHVEIKLD